MDRLSRRIDGSSRRIVEGVITSSLLICAVILFVSEMPWLAFFCSLAAVFLLARLLFGYISPWEFR